jgi:hypothetical protein
MSGKNSHSCSTIFSPLALLMLGFLMFVYQLPIIPTFFLLIKPACFAMLCIFGLCISTASHTHTYCTIFTLRTLFKNRIFILGILPASDTHTFSITFRHKALLCFVFLSSVCQLPVKLTLKCLRLYTSIFSQIIWEMWKKFQIIWPYHIRLVSFV